ncbi:MAG: 50S ribosomal protein L18, partial [SAR202 cluster bacterium]
MSKKTRSLGRNKRHLRVRKRLAGTQDRPRVSLFRSNRNIYLQLIDDNEGKTLASVSSL